MTFCRFLILFMILAWAGAARAACVPEANQAAFFQDANYSGACSIRGVGNYPTSQSTGLDNDSISSIRLGPGTKVYACRDAYFGGRCEMITADASFLGPHPIGNDEITALKVQTTVEPATCVPGSGQASFFIDANFSGSCVTRGLGDYPSAQAIGLPNDSVSSVRLGPGAQAYICVDDHFQGACEVITASVGFLGGHTVGNDQITSAKVQTVGVAQTCTPGASEVAFFQDANFTGPCVVKGPGSYPSSEAVGLANDTVSSVRLGGAAQAVVCRDAGFGGDCVRLTDDVANMHDTRIDNDTLSSASVEARGSQDCAPGADQVAFFMHSDYVAPCVVRGIGDYPSADQIGLPNNSISSVLVGAGAQVVLCVDVGYQNDCAQANISVPNLAALRIGTDQVSSAKVQAAGTQDCRPGPGQVSFFEHALYVAPCTVRGIGDYPNAEGIGLPNDSISSILIGPEAQVEVCVDDSYGGDCQRFTSDIGDMGITRIGNDEITSAKVQKLGETDCPPAAAQVSVYEHSDFVAPCVIKGVGDYPDSAAMGIGDNAISSLRVSASVQLCACEGANYGNVCQAFTADAASLGSAFPTLHGGNDLISSFKVQTRGQACVAVAPPPQGYSQIEVFNCHSEMHTVNIWMRDDTIGGSYIDQGTQASNWANGSCPSGSPKVIALKNLHSFDFIFVDPAWCGGQNDPQNLPCQKGLFGPVQGLDAGPSLTYQVD